VVRENGSTGRMSARPPVRSTTRLASVMPCVTETNADPE
jgi:hypothetical protein